MEQKSDIYDREGGFKIRPAKVRGFIVESAPRYPGQIPETLAACATIEEVVETIRLLFSAEVVVGEVEAPAENCTMILLIPTTGEERAHIFFGADHHRRAFECGQSYNGGGEFRSFKLFPDVEIHR